ERIVDEPVALSGDDRLDTLDEFVNRPERFEVAVDIHAADVVQDLVPGKVGPPLPRVRFRRVGLGVVVQVLVTQSGCGLRCPQPHLPPGVQLTPPIQVCSQMGWHLRATPPGMKNPRDHWRFPSTCSRRRWTHAPTAVSAPVPAVVATVAKVRTSPSLKVWVTAVAAPTMAVTARA